MAAQRAPLPGGRWHFQHGPMDIVIGAEGRADAVAAAHEAAWQRFVPLLEELVAELPLLRAAVAPGARPAHCPLHGAVARRMWLACAPHSADFITPMAAVAGAVAQALVPSYARDGVQRAWVNNGGDIALHLAPGAQVRVGLYADLARLAPEELQGRVQVDGHFDVTHAMPVRGVATSGWRGRSFSLGIADSVTVLAATAAQADAAASIIANAVDIPDAARLGVQRLPACDLKDDSDLGTLPVTVDVPPLPPARVQAALAAGLQRAEALRAAGLIAAAALVCQGQLVVTRGFEALGGRCALPEAGRETETKVGSVFA